MIKHGLRGALAVVLTAASLLAWAHEEEHAEAAASEAISNPTLDSQPPPPTLAVVLWGSNNVSFQRTLFGSSLRLRVTGPDYVYEQTYDNSNPAFVAQEDDGQPLPDGIYRYELREILEIGEEIEETLSSLSYTEQQAQKRQWRREGRWPLPRPQTQSAVFRIEDGHLRAPN